MAGRSKEAMKQQCAVVKKLYESGYLVEEIAEELGVSLNSIYNCLTVLGMDFRKSRSVGKSLVYADNSVVLEKVFINDRRYIDITPMLVSG